MIDRRDVLKGAVATLTTAIFTGRVKGANDHVAVASRNLNSGQLTRLK